MAMRFYINNGETVSQKMGWDYMGACVSFLFFDGSGNPATVTGTPTVQGSEYDTGESWQLINPFSRNEWRYNGPLSRVKVSLAGVTGYTTYQVVIWRTDISLPLIPEGAYGGLRAQTIQSYDECNKKTGRQWEASRLVTVASNAEIDNVYSIIRTGSQPVDMKSRTLGYTGLGVAGRIYKNPVFTGGTNDPWFNMNPRYLGTQPQAEILVGFTLTSKGTKCGADIISVGPASNQSRGATPREFGSNRIFDEPNTTYLLEIASLDPASQQVMARLEIYEGGLDLPLGV